MKYIYQFGFDLVFFVLWFRVSPQRFIKSASPFLLSAGQMEVKPEEILPVFIPGPIWRDGWRLYRVIEREKYETR